ncbi:MAG: hypothetical protein EZS28_043806 [Streblomastix strix]|uniref:Uncharacterized protein n=1 Tax=Streblomastix strix TaxID=222440 RepID=A0A5J4TQZ3_9EUKA|nr:MAG: hypothetical protein EZS28_043806 [Streblomastix strix]
MAMEQPWHYGTHLLYPVKQEKINLRLSELEINIPPGYEEYIRISLYNVIKYEQDALDRTILPSLSILSRRIVYFVHNNVGIIGQVEQREIESVGKLQYQQQQQEQDKEKQKRSKSKEKGRRAQSLGVLGRKDKDKEKDKENQQNQNKLVLAGGPTWLNVGGIYAHPQCGIGIGVVYTLEIPIWRKQRKRK